MLETEKKSFTIERLNQQGQITIPDDYRRALDLSDGSAIAVLHVGDVIVLAPYDDEFAEVAGRLEVAMHDSGLTLEDMLDEAGKVRADIVKKEFGYEGE